MNESTTRVLDELPKQSVEPKPEPECCDVYAEYCYSCPEGEHDPRDSVEDDSEPH